ncbi:proto-oncogene FRAT1 [Myotis lucifugus]|uniref:proto-oncogene FRAT1 n=1 Tax=Myotis lucifugus TaxID=59463 RepID=UPI000CCBE0FB|nr:proto-oncogene FRAT1 [Myotis lucifugus]
MPVPGGKEEKGKPGRKRRGEERREDQGNFLLLERSVTLGGSGEVDRLVAQIGETLQLDAGQDSPASLCAPPGPPLQPPRPPAAVLADKARPPQLGALPGTSSRKACGGFHSRRLQLHAKLPQRPLLRPPTAAGHKPPSPRSPRAACSNPGATGRRAQLRSGDGVLVPGS